MARGVFKVTAPLMGQTTEKRTENGKKLFMKGSSIIRLFLHETGTFSYSL